MWRHRSRAVFNEWRANDFVGVQERGSPRQAHAKATQCEVLVFGAETGVQLVDEGDGDGGAGGVAEVGQCIGGLFAGDAELFSDGLVEEEVGLVEDEVVGRGDVAVGEGEELEEVGGDFGEGEVEDVEAFHGHVRGGAEEASLLLGDVVGAFPDGLACAAFGDDDGGVAFAAALEVEVHGGCAFGEFESGGGAGI